MCTGVLPVCVRMYHMCAGAMVGLGPLELELHMVVVGPLREQRTALTP